MNGGDSLDSRTDDGRRQSSPRVAAPQEFGLLPRSSILKFGGAVQATSLLSLIVANLALPLVFGREGYSEFTLILAKALIPLGLVDIPADIGYLRIANGADTEGTARWEYMPTKIACSTVLAMLLALLTRTPPGGVLAVVVLATGLSMLSAVLHEAYLASDGRCAVEVSIVMLVTQLAVPVSVGSLLAPPVTALLCGSVAVVLGQHARRRVAAGWRSPGREGLRLLFLTIRNGAIASYMNSVIQWLAVLRVGFNGATEVGSMKLSFALMNGAQAVVPLSGSIVISTIAHVEPDDRQRVIRRLWALAVAASSCMAVGLLLLRSVIVRIYGAEYPEVPSVLPIASAGIVGMVVYWLFWPVVAQETEDGRVSKQRTRLVTIVALLTALAIVVAAVSITAGLAIYVTGISCGAWAASVQANVGRRSVAVFAPLLALIGLHLIK